jgi:hypothetical protein
LVRSWGRIGIHLGDVLERNGDVFGTAVNIAARLEDIAEPGGIVVSSAIRDAYKGRAVDVKQVGRELGVRYTGRPKGSRNKLSEDFVAALYNDFQDHGSAAIAACREEKPDVYVRVIASLLPKDVNMTTRNLDDLSDDQPMWKLAMLTEMVKPLLAKLPTVIDVTPVGVDVGVDSKTAADTPDKSSTYRMHMAEWIRHTVLGVGC